MRLAQFERKARTKMRILRRYVTGERGGDIVPVSLGRLDDLVSTNPGVEVLWNRFNSGRGLVDVESVCVEGDERECLASFSDGREEIVIQVSGGEFAFRNELLCTRSGDVLFIEGHTREQVLASREYLEPIKAHIAGTVAYLSNTWIDNYYHWLLLTLPLLELYDQAVGLNNIDAFYLGPSHLERIQRETLEAFRISPARVIRHSCTADRMLHASIIHPVQHGQRYRDSCSHHFVRAALADRFQRPVDRKRVFIARGKGHTRQIGNEQALVQFLGRYGVESIEMGGKTLAQQAAILASADLVVGAHGAGMTNTLFAQPGTRVLELYSPDHVEPGMYSIAAHCELVYGHVVGVRTGNDGTFTIGVDKVAAVLSRMGFDQVAHDSSAVQTGTG